MAIFGHKIYFQLERKGERNGKRRHLCSGFSTPPIHENYIIIVEVEKKMTMLQFKILIFPRL